jgi:multidrug resistance efflux pump
MVVTTPDLETLYKILGEYAKRSEFDDYTLKSDRDDILKRVAKMEKRLEDNTDKLIKWEPEWEKMQANIEYLMQNKIDQATLDDAIERLKNIISQMSGGSGVVAAFDQDELKEHLKRLQAEVDALKKTSFQTTQDLNKLHSAHAETQKVTFANQGNL